MNVTRTNYMTLANSGAIPFAKMPKDLADTHGEMTDYLEFYSEDADIKAVVDLYLQKVNSFIAKINSPVPVIKPAPPQDIRPIVEPTVVEVLDVEPKAKTAGFFSSGWGKLLMAGIGASLLFGSSNFLGDDSKASKK